MPGSKERGGQGDGKGQASKTTGRLLLDDTRIVLSSSAIADP